MAAGTKVASSPLAFVVHSSQCNPPPPIHTRTTTWQDLWRDFLADFVLQVVRRPVVAAGNSIGGFITASLAADYPGLVEGLVLLNSAGGCCVGGSVGVGWVAGG